MYMFDKESRELSRKIIVFINGYVCSSHNEILAEHVTCITRKWGKLIKLKRTLAPCMSEILAIWRKTIPSTNSSLFILSNSRA